MKWEKVKLGEVTDVRDGTHDSPRFVEYGYPLVTSKNIKNGLLDFTDINYISEQDYNEINKRSKVDSGDILMPMIGTIGNPVIVKEVADFAIKNVCLVKKNSSICNRYIYYLLQSSLFEQYLLKKSRGGTQKFLSLSDIRSFEIPLPPLHIQEQIADTLDKADALRKKDQELLQKYDELAQSIFYDMFGDPVRNEKGWQVKKLGSVTKITSGGTPNRKINQYYENGKIPWVKTGDLKVRHLYASEEFITQLAIEESSAKVFPVNTVLVALYGATIGACSVLKFEAATNQACGAILPNQELTADFLYWFFRIIKADLILKGVGGAQPNISGEILKQLSVIVPPLSVQVNFLEKLERIFKGEQLMKSNILQSELLTSGLSNTYFS